ncbi:hypothetical protein JNW90_05765 [Micromonospora sp. STR1s_5]|nr:hypothetical protein [Micromonospora sp. STR1s_5]
MTQASSGAPGRIEAEDQSTTGGHEGRDFGAEPGDPGQPGSTSVPRGRGPTPIRPGSANSWSADTPPPGTPYELPAAPNSRAGIMINAAADSVTIRGNLIRDTKSHTQTHGILITDRGDCVNCRVVENDLDGNRFAIQTDTPPGGGHWEGNHGDQ